MIIGRGMLANAFSAYSENEDVLIFASGVSNSCLNEKSAFDREKKLLLESIANYPKCVLVYFGTCSVEDPELCNSPYVMHKREMEELIEKSCKRYFIFRLSQVVGEGSSPTLINFIVNKLQNRELFHVWKNSTRNLIDVDDVFKVADYLIKNNLYANEITNIATPISLSIFHIVEIIEELLGLRGDYEILPRGGSYDIDTLKIAHLFDEMLVCFDEKYPSMIIKKYFLKKIEE
ncbi:MAG: NAD-dependent epimerase/dehydratase family protein [Sulfurimonas sp.]|nr:NAD-dependent epimerase/dehydratase family protein [Sulfurimonas sp.]